jgi:hypothetical protein
MLRVILTAVLLSSATMVIAEPIVTESTSTVITPPPTAVSPGINNTNSDLCVVAESGAVQTQILGVSSGSTAVDVNCERLKISKTLYDMGMKVAAVSVMCQDPRVFDAMLKAGTPCPIDGKIGEEALATWEKNPEMKPEQMTSEMTHGKNKNILLSLGAIALLGIAVSH